MHFDDILYWSSQEEVAEESIRKALIGSAAKKFRDFS